MRQYLTLAVLAYLARIPGVVAECCISDEYTGTCQDGKLPEAYYCGARGDGACNVFGCNCLGGCIPIAIEDIKRSAHEQVEVRTSTESPALDIFRSADVDQDDWLDAAEVAFYFRRQGLEVDDEAWVGMDVDKDGRLSPKEIDSDLES